MPTSESATQNITVRLNRRILRKAKILAAKRNTSIRGLLAEQIEALVGEDDAYERTLPGLHVTIVTRAALVARGRRTRARGKQPFRGEPRARSGHPGCRCEVGFRRNMRRHLADTYISLECPVKEPRRRRHGQRLHVHRDAARLRTGRTVAG